MSDRLEDTSLRLKDEMDLYKRMMDKLRQNRLEFNKEREATQEVGNNFGGIQPVHLLCPLLMLMFYTKIKQNHVFNINKKCSFKTCMVAGLVSLKQGCRNNGWLATIFKNAFLKTSKALSDMLQ